MEQSKSVESITTSKPRHHRANGSKTLNIYDYIHQMNPTNNHTSKKKSKHSRNKKHNSSHHRPLSDNFTKHKSSWFTKSNSHSPSPQHRPRLNNSNTSYGYIQSLPTSSTNHGWIYHPQYGMILFTYNQAVETARNQKLIKGKYNNDHNGDISESESYNDHTNHLHLPESNRNHSHSPVRPVRPYNKYSGYRSRSPSPSPIPIDNNNNAHYDMGLSDINRLYVYQPVKFELSNNKQDDSDHSPICNVSEYEEEEEKEMIVETEYDITSKNLKWKNNNNNNTLSVQNNTIESQKQNINIRKKYKKTPKGGSNPNMFRSRSKKKGKSVFNDGDDTESENDVENNHHSNEYRSRRISRKSRYSQQKTLSTTKHKLGPRPTYPVPLPPKKKTVSNSFSNDKTYNKKKQHKNSKKRQNKKSKALTLDLSDINTNNNKVTNGTPIDDITSPVSPQLTLQPSISRGKSRNRTEQRMAMNVKVLNSVQNNDCNLYAFSPRGKHYKPIQLHQSSSNGNDDILKLQKDNGNNIKDSDDDNNNNNNNNNNKSRKDKKEKHVLYEIELKPRPRNPRSKIVNDNDNKDEETKIIKSHKSKLKMPKFGRLRKKSSSDALHQWLDSKNNKLATPFCPSMSQYYVRDACLLHWEGKNIEEIKQHGVKKCVTKKLFSDEHKSTVKVGENVFFSMTSDVEQICDELEEKINRLFNNNGGTIYIGIKSTHNKKKIKVNTNYLLNVNSNGSKHGKSSSFTFTKSNILNKHKQNNNNNNNNVSSAMSHIDTVRNHVIVGIKLNSKMRYKLKTMIINDILKGFTPQVPYLLQNCDLKFIPVISQSGKIISRYFVIKISVVAPILGMNGEKIQFRTKDGYAHVVDF